MRKLWKTLPLAFLMLALFGCLPEPGALRAVIRTDPNPARGPYPLEVRFDGRGSQGPIEEWVWTFFRLEGNEEVPLQLSLSGPEVTHIFGERGRYRVYLTVRAAGERFAQNSVDVDVRSQPPVARFYVTPGLQVQEDTTVTFDASESFDPDPDGEIVGYYWNFGDNTGLGVGMVVHHEYKDPGIYEVKLVVEDDYGDIGDYSVEIQVVRKGCGSCP
ncbi:PKD domain-containing protein [Candidatus Bipolaricaulota bacterium]|nr:PKD domain-containing protein [Candidatus Bipolaricaulota bacterium]